MKALLWREWRWNRLILVAGAVMFLLPYVIALIVMPWPKEKPQSAEDVENWMVFTAFSSFVISPLTLTFVGGNAIAGERSDRTAEFLAYLPVSKVERLAAKLSFIAIIAALVWGVNWLVIGGLHYSTDVMVRQLFEPTKNVALVSVVMCGVAWLVSSLQSSPTFAVCAGILTPILIGFGLTMVVWATGNESANFKRELFETGFPIACLTLGTLGFAGGTWYFLKRVEP